MADARSAALGLCLALTLPDARSAALGLCLALALGACGSSPDSRMERARELTYEKKHAEAAEEYRAVLAELGKREDPEAIRGRALAWERLGDLAYLELGDPGAGADAYRRLIAEAPGSPEAWAGREKLADIAEHHFHDLHEAIAEWQALAVSGRSGADSFAYRAAKGYFELHDFEQCRKECRALATRSPDGDFADDALFLAAVAYQFEARHREAITGFEEVQRRWPATELAARARFQVGQSQAALGQLEPALATYVEALKDHPDPGRIQPEIARLRRLIALAKNPGTEHPLARDVAPAAAAAPAAAPRAPPATPRATAPEGEDPFREDRADRSAVPRWDPPAVAPAGKPEATERPAGKSERPASKPDAAATPDSPEPSAARAPPSPPTPEPQ